MHTTIGHNATSIPHPRAGLAIVTLTILFDLILAAFQWTAETRYALALIAFASLLVYVFEGDLKSLGLHPHPRQGWRLWCRWTLRIGIIMAAILTLVATACVLLKIELPVYTTPPRIFLYRFLHMCVQAPALEETIYRLVFCVPLVARFGCWPVIILNGILFGALHVIYGNPSPENLIGGAFLAWAYLKSESFLVPFLLHALGNFIALTTQVVVWHL